ncbi:ATP-dependent RNA helicase [Musa troglodytarum]|uniref:RNA helicase n=1 Tax=Musa troglodytarum TaxID=320322 RepID=A0A9E7LFF0_9LILI|nr:ATP-dependent RNA helicase [Musa troglodytarum]
MILTPPYKDLVAQAHNGSGKTTCFVIGMLSRVDPKRKIPQAICICPTRELAQQNHAVLLKMAKYTGITSMCAIPSDSANYIPINKRPPVTEQVVIGTPGTIKKWTSAKKLSTRDVKILVFDEADHMLAEDGFRDDSERIMKEIQRSSGGCQVLLFSATFDEAVKAFVSRHDNPSEPDCELYLHRVGRTGRFGSKGAVFNFLCTARDRSVMEKIERHFRHHIPEIPNWRSEEDFESALKDAGLL